MKYFRFILFGFFFSLCTLSVLAQDRMWVEGEIYTADSLLPIKNVHIISRLNRRGTISDEEGKFKLPARTIDTIMFSAIGFQRSIMAFDSTMTADGKTWKILLRKDTIWMDEVVVRSFYDWPTFKQLFVNMQPLKPVKLDNIQDDLKDILLYMDPAPMTIKGPIQALYDIFNDAARLQRRLQRNRRVYNEQLIKEGRYDELIPEEPEHERQAP